MRDVSDVFADTESSVIGGALDTGGTVAAVPLFGFDGLVVTDAGAALETCTLCDVGMSQSLTSLNQTV